MSSNTCQPDGHSNLPMKKAFKKRVLKAFVLSLGRCERIRTFDPLHPMQVRYQAAPHTELKSNYNRANPLISVCQREQVTNFKQLPSHEQHPVRYKIG